LLSLEQRTDLRPDFRERVRAVRMDLHARLERELGQRWTLLGQRRLEMVRTMAAAIGPVAVNAGARDCSGALIPPAAAAAPNGNVGPQTDRALTAETGR